MNKSKEKDKPNKYIKIYSPGARGLPFKDKTV
jgi:hypothetical protein